MSSFSLREYIILSEKQVDSVGQDVCWGAGIMLWQHASGPSALRWWKALPAGSFPFASPVRCECTSFFFDDGHDILELFLHTVCLWNKVLRGASVFNEQFSGRHPAQHCAACRKIASNRLFQVLPRSPRLQTVSLSLASISSFRASLNWLYRLFRNDFFSGVSVVAGSETSAAFFFFF